MTDRISLERMEQEAYVYNMAPLEYRVALEAASSWCFGLGKTRVLCQSKMFYPEVSQRQNFIQAPPYQSMLWLEPQIENWKNILEECRQQDSTLSHLAAVLSLPPAKYLPGRPEVDSRLGVQIGGIRRLCRGIKKMGFEEQAIFGMHCGQAVLLNALANRLHWAGWNALGDRMAFLAKKHYTKPLQKAWGATCALVLAAKR